MLIKSNINMKLKTLIKVFDNNDFFSKHNNEKLDQMLNNFVEKYKHTEHFLNSIVIKIVVSNNYIYKEDLNFNNILYVYEVHKIILLKKILAKENIKFENKEITVCLMQDSKDNSDLHNIEDYALSFLMHESNKINNHKDFENSFKKEKSFYVKNAKESVLNTLYSNNKKKIFRRNSEDKFTKFEKIQDTIDYKYANVHCPVCSIEFEKLSESEKKNFKLHKFEINEDVIDDLIHVERNIQRISFNCLHQDMKISTSKFFIKADDFNIDLHIEDKRKVQIWFLKNLNYLAKRVLNEAS